LACRSRSGPLSPANSKHVLLLGLVFMRSRSSPTNSKHVLLTDLVSTQSRCVLCLLITMTLIKLNAIVKVKLKDYCLGNSRMYTGMDLG